MIVSHRHKFIFLKTRKTAGTSIEVALSRVCGDDDIITVIRGEDEDVRRALGYRGPQNYSVPLRRYQRRDWRRLVTKRRRAKFYNHIPATEARAYLGDDVWNSYFKFCFERNPWDRIVSAYFFRKYQIDDPSLSFTDFLQREPPRTFSNYAIYSIGRDVAVDFIGRFENLVADFDKALAQIGIRESLELPRLKAKSRTDKRPYREFLTADQQRLIAERCEPEIQLLDYRFE
jgi:hypothetical protein